MNHTVTGVERTIAEYQALARRRLDLRNELETVDHQHAKMLLRAAAQVYPGATLGFVSDRGANQWLEPDDHVVFSSVTTSDGLTWTEEELQESDFGHPGLYAWSAQGFTDLADPFMESRFPLGSLYWTNEARFDSSDTLGIMLDTQPVTAMHSGYPYYYVEVVLDEYLASLDARRKTDP